MKQLNASNTPESEKDCAQTPWWFIRSVEHLIGSPFTLDVCAMETTKKAPLCYTLERGESGLELGWGAMNWCNMPFSNIEPWIEKSASESADIGAMSMLLFPDNTETAYSRLAWEKADTIIRMPFRLNFLRPDGTEFLDKHGKKQGPQFPVVCAWFTPMGLKAPTRTMYHDFREGFLCPKK